MSHCKGTILSRTSSRRSISSSEKWKTLQNYSKLQSQIVQMYGYVFHDTNGQTRGQTLKIQWFLVNEICTITHKPAYCGRDKSKKFCWDLDGRKYWIEIVYLLIEHRVYSHRYTWMTSKWLEEKQNLSPIWKKLMKLVDLGEPTSFLDHVYLGCTQRECKSNENTTKENEKMLESRIAAGATA